MRKKSKCPVCHTNMHFIGYQDLMNNTFASANFSMTVKWWKCRQCGYSEWGYTPEDDPEDDEDDGD